MSFSQQVKQRMQEKRISQNDLAKAAGISSSGISTALNVDGNPRLQTMQAIADALGVHLAELLSDGRSAPSVSTEERLLLAYFRRLNPEGRARMLEQAEDLAARDRYTQEAARIG